MIVYLLNIIYFNPPVSFKASTEQVKENVSAKIVSKENMSAKIVSNKPSRKIMATFFFVKLQDGKD